jgi:hypothetical protein
MARAGPPPGWHSPRKPCRCVRTVYCMMDGNDCERAGMGGGCCRNPIVEGGRDLRPLRVGSAVWIEERTGANCAPVRDCSFAWSELDEVPGFGGAGPLHSKVTGRGLPPPEFLLPPTTWIRFQLFSGSSKTMENGRLITALNCDPTMSSIESPRLILSAHLTGSQLSYPRPNPSYCYTYISWNDSIADE